ncbi:SLC5/6 family protein [Helicobacter labacensis]|uniref:aromatic amino acid transport family protein n=1 Tax=Helicobacter labacensis TaxID=2316079 RepID=UPI000EAC7EC7|nr:aromatic amino acid transport family protein [Helicobacter labacensis]
MQKKQTRAFDRSWVLSLFGVAVGAGILFLPINAGLGGFWIVVLLCVIVFPMVFFAHRALSYFVLSAKESNADITCVVREHFGENLGKWMTFLYFFAIYPACLIYGVGITNTVENFMHMQLHVQPPHRLLLAWGLITLMVLALIFTEKIMLKITQALVYPLIIILALFSLYLIPYWRLDMLLIFPSFADSLKILYTTLPVLVFAFDYSPAISNYSLSIRRAYGAQAFGKTSAILWRTSMLLFVFVMFFVFSCILCVDPAQLQAAKAQNISILSYFADKFNDPLIAYSAPLIAFLAITTSFLGHYIGAKEGLSGLVAQILHKQGRRTQAGVHGFLYLSMVLVAYANPSVLDFIENLGGPIIALMLFILPMYAMYKIPALQPYQNKFSDTFLVVLGLLALSSIVQGLF